MLCRIDLWGFGESSSVDGKAISMTEYDVLEHGTTQLINDFIPKALSPTASEEKIKFLQKILVTQTPTAVASALRGMALRDDTSKILANTTLPILIVTGDQDALISPQQSQNMHALAKNSKLITIPKAGHLSSLEQSDEWNQAVINMFYHSENTGMKIHFINNRDFSFFTLFYEPESRIVGPKVRKNGGTADLEYNTSHTWVLVLGTTDGGDGLSCDTE